MTLLERQTRNQDIVSHLDSQDMTTGELGLKWQITRERVSQIYYKSIGVSSRGKLQEGRHQRSIKKAAHVFSCANCQRQVDRNQTKWLRKYCSDCNKLYRTRDLNRTLVCTGCGISYHPLHIHLYFQFKSNFHSQTCYTSYRKTHHA